MVVLGQLPLTAARRYESCVLADKPRSCKSSIMRCRNGVIEIPPVGKFDRKYIAVIEE